MSASPKRSTTLYTSVARTATPAVVDQQSGGSGIYVVIDVTAVTSTPSVVVTIDGFDPASGKYYNLLTSVAIATVSTTVLEVRPGATPAANVAANRAIPATYRVVPTHGNGNSITYTIGVCVLP